MSSGSKESETEDISASLELEPRANILSLMRNMIDHDNQRKTVEIFDETNHSIYPTFWAKSSQLATCRSCGKTGETIIKRKCGIGNACCSCWFFLVCMCICIPCLCCIACDVQHYCPYCKTRQGMHTFI